MLPTAHLSFLHPAHGGSNPKAQDAWGWAAARVEGAREARTEIRVETHHHPDLGPS